MTAVPSPRRIVITLFVLCLTTVLSSATPASATGCAPRYSEITSANTTTNGINLRGASAGADICYSCIADAAEAWNSSCAGSGNPALLTSSSASIDVNVDFFGGSNPGTFQDCGASKCACTRVTFQNGAIAGASVKIFQSAGGSDCAGSWTDILTHEFGHVLGLDDADSSTCGGRIMADVSGLILQEDCDQIDMNYLTGVERPDDDRDHPCQNPPA